VKDPRISLVQILECLDRIRAYTKDGKRKFDHDSMVRDAVIRNFEIIGEASKRVPMEFREQTSEIPWRGLSGFRDVLIHQYEGVDYERVWRIIEEDLPGLRSAISKALPPLDVLERDINGESGD